MRSTRKRRATAGDSTTVGANLVRRILKRVKGVEGLCLLGSVARGDASKWSDIDLLIVGTDDELTPTGIVRALGDRTPRRISIIYYTVERLLKQRERGTLFIEHVRREGIPLYDRHGVLRDLFEQPYRLDPGFDLRRYMRRLRIYRHPRRFGDNHLFCLAHLYSLGKGVAMVALASRGIYEFNRDRAFEQLASRSPALERDVATIAALRPYYAMVGGREPEPLPRSYYHAERLVTQAVEAIGRIALWTVPDATASY